MTVEILPQFIEIPANKRSVWMRKSIYGIGKNDAPYMTQPKINGKTIFCPFYVVWNHMIERCYSEKCQAKHPTYIGCTVTEGWHSFMNFKQWMEGQSWKGKELDKDIIVIGNKLYSPETCVFVPISVNSLLTHVQSNKGKYPTGVSFNKEHSKFASYISLNGKQKHLGYFVTPEEAGEAYKITKSEEIIRVALLQSDVKIKNGLIRHADNLLNS